MWFGMTSFWYPAAQHRKIANTCRQSHISVASPCSLLGSYTLSSLVGIPISTNCMWRN